MESVPIPYVADPKYYLKTVLYISTGRSKMHKILNILTHLQIYDSLYYDLGFCSPDSLLPN